MQLRYDGRGGARLAAPAGAMTAREDPRLDLDPVAEAALARRVLAMTGVFWLAHLALMSGRAATGMLSFTWAASEARLLVSVVGAVFCLLVYLALRQMRAGGGLRRFALAAAMCVPVCAAFTLIDICTFLLLVPMKDPWQAAFQVQSVIETYLYFLLEFIAWSALYATMVGAAQVHDRDQRLAVAESAAQRAQLAALRLQIQPHFLFNTLNTLSGLIALGRSAEAEQLILNLSSLMRRTLAAAPDQMGPVGEEIRAQLMYLAIEQARFPDRLQVRCDTDEACFGALAPGMILQPLVENAVKHGLAPSEGEVRITVGCARRGEELDIWVDNSPAPLDHRAVSAGLGIGLTNVRQRLSALFGERARLEAGPHAGGWTSRIVIPWTSST